MQVHNPFIIESDVPYSLNFLVYIQNAYLNSKNDESKNPKFPYIDVSKWALIEDERFLIKFKDVWGKVVHNIVSVSHFDNHSVLENNKLLFRTLFQNNHDGEIGYHESCKSFMAWWEGLAGKLAIVHVVNNQMYKVYKEISETIKEDKRLTISLVYDKFPLGELQTLPWYAVLPIEDIFFQKKKEIVPLLLSCCEGKY